MRIEDWSRTRWVVFSVMLGLGLSFVRTQLGQPSPNQTTTPIKLEQKLLREPVTDADQRQYPWAKHVRVYPSIPLESEPGKASQLRLTVVTFSLLEVQGSEFVYRPGSIRMEEPVTGVGREFAAEDLTTRAYLDAISERIGHRVYQYCWWLEPRWIYPLWTGCALLLVGIAWPIVLDRLIRAGYGRRSESLAPSLWERWRMARAEKARRAASAASDPMLQQKQVTDPRGLSADELARLEAMEEGLRDFALTGSGNPDDSGAPIVETPVRELRAGPIQAQPQVAPPSKEDKDYRGEFYPTVAHGKRKTDGSQDEQ